MDRLDYSSQVHAFMRSNAALDEAGMATLRALATHEDDIDAPLGPHRSTSNRNQSADFCLMSAATYAQIDKMKVLIEEFGADIDAHNILMSDNTGQQIKSNLLEEVLQSFLYRPDVDRSPAGLERVAQAVEYLLQNGVSACENEHYQDNPTREAAILADPKKALNPASPLYDYILELAPTDPSLFFCAKSQPFTKPYELIRQYQPEAIARFEQGLKEAKVSESDMADAFSVSAMAKKQRGGKPHGLIQQLGNIFHLKF